jgi:16S rRNA (uracil1498-N3)-methyltransferase
LLIGPEGGWSDAEREAARHAGFSAVGLGEGILRAETAAMAAMAVVGHWVSRVG